MPTYQVFSSRLNLIHMLGFLSGDRRLGCRQRARGLGRSVCSRCRRRAACPDLGRVNLGLVLSWCFAISLWATVLKESLEITSLKRQAFRFELRKLKSFGLDGLDWCLVAASAPSRLSATLPRHVHDVQTTQRADGRLRRESNWRLACLAPPGISSLHVYVSLWVFLWRNRSMGLLGYCISHLWTGWNALNSPSLPSYTNLAVGVLLFMLLLRHSPARIALPLSAGNLVSGHWLFYARTLPHFHPGLQLLHLHVLRGNTYLPSLLGLCTTLPSKCYYSGCLIS